jgi:sigma-E factor negative regulatory protein RseC
MGQVLGVVTRVEAGQALVECNAAAAGSCSTCASGRGCGWQRSGLRRQVRIDCPADEHRLQPGDNVSLSVDDRQLLGAALRLYLPPLAGLLAGPALLRAGGWEQGAMPLLAAAVGLAFGALLAWRWTRVTVPLHWQRLESGPGEGDRS